MTRATGAAIASALKGQASRDTMPVQFADAGDAEVTLEVRFGGTPRDGAAVVELAVPDEVPRHRSGSGPRYPDEYRRNNIEGEVIVAFVIDTAGRIEPETFRVIAFSAPLFLSSVRSALRTMRFYPLVVDCSPRRMVGVQPFNFTLWR